MSLRTLQERLTALQNTTKQVEELIQRLSNLNFQPGSVPLDDEDGDVSAELSGEIHQTLKEQSEDLELLEQEVEDLPTGRPGSDQDRDRAELSSRVGRAGQELKVLRKEFRKAQLTAKYNLEQAQKAERALLLLSLADPSSSTESLPIPRKKNLSSSVELSKDEKIINAASDVTAALRRTHMLMQTELSRSQFAHDTLKESTAALSQLGEQYSTLDTLLSSSRNLLGTLLKSQKSDTWYLETAFYVLVATIVWLIFRRFVYGPAWWFIWLPLKMFYKAWMGVFTAVGLRSSRDGVFASESVGTTVLEASGTVMRSSAPEVSYGSPLADESPRPTEPAIGRDESMVEEVGKIIDDSQQAKGSGQEQESGRGVEGAQQGGSDKPNPKKRMWEEPVQAKKEDQRKKDEL